MDSVTKISQTNSILEESIISQADQILQTRLKESKTLVKQNGETVEIVTLTLADAIPGVSFNLNKSQLQLESETQTGSGSQSESLAKPKDLCYDNNTTSKENRLDADSSSKVNHISSRADRNDQFQISLPSRPSISTSLGSKSLISAAEKRIIVSNNKITNICNKPVTNESVLDSSIIADTDLERSSGRLSTDNGKLNNNTSEANIDNSNSDNQFLIVSNPSTSTEFTASHSDGKLTFISTKLSDMDSSTSNMEGDCSLAEQIEIEPHRLPYADTDVMLHTPSNDELLKDYSTCLICGDKGSGFHYSVFSCEGCKGFFKRSVQKNLTYTCKSDGTCEINRYSRNNCQYCRFRKCLQFGMKKEGVRDDRTPGGLARTRLKRFRRPDHEYLPITESEQSQIQLENDIQLLVNCDPYIAPCFVTTEEKTATLYGAFQLTSILYDDLIYAVRWAKNVLGFQTLEFDDQKRLLGSCLVELSLLRVAYRSFGSVDGRLRFAHDIELTLAESHQLGFDQEYLDAVVFLVEKLKTLELDDKEYAILSAILLFQEDAIGLRDTMTVLKLQKKYLTVLQRYIRLVYAGDLKRYGRMLLRLPGIRTAAHSLQEVFQEFIVMDRPPVEDLIDSALADDSDVHTTSHLEAPTTQPMEANTDAPLANTIEVEPESIIVEASITDEAVDAMENVTQQNT